MGGGWVAALWRWRSWDFFVFVFAAVNLHVNLLNVLNICSAGELRAEPRAMRLVNHPFRLDSRGCTRDFYWGIGGAAIVLS